MARHPEGWSLYRDPRTRHWIARFRHAGRRFHFSTRTTDPRAAKLEAARLYAEVISSRRAGHALRGDLAVALAEWIASSESEVAPESAEAWETYAFRLWVPYFKTAAAFTGESLADYKRARLRAVTRSTLLKEFSALRRFFGWLSERGFDVPDVPSIPKRAAGGRAIERPLVVLTPEEVEAILEALPERTRRGHPARAFHRVLWETGLRRGTLRRLSMPEHYRRGAGELVIDARIDKSRYGRTVPLTPAATAALDSVLPKRPGLIFGAVGYRHELARAALAAGLEPDRAAHVGSHSFRHARTTALLAAGANLPGVAYLMGHRHLTTTNAYVHAPREAAAAALGAYRATKRATEPGLRRGKSRDGGRKR